MKFSKATGLVLLQLWAATAIKLTRDDLVIAIPTDEEHIPLAKAGRAWRKGIRTVIAINSYPSQETIDEGKAHNETWVFYPDDEPLRSLYRGDTRAALAGFIAHKELGDTYKWVLYGDDDTIFFVENALRLLEDFNSSMPYFITDHMWYTVKGHHSHPNWEAPRCLPCHFNDKLVNKSLAKAKTWEPAKGCPCTAELLCKTDKRKAFNEHCDMPRAPKTIYSMHGGAGAIMSIGLLRAVPWNYMEQCVKSLFSTGGDAFLSICLWQAGYAHTDPGISFYRPDLQLFDPGPEDRLGMMTKLAQALDHRCDSVCLESLLNTITLHTRSRMFPNLHDAGVFIKALSGMYANVIEMTHHKNKYIEARRNAEAKAIQLAAAKVDGVAGTQGNAATIANAGASAAAQATAVPATPANAATTANAGASAAAQATAVKATPANAATTANAGATAAAQANDLTATQANAAVVATGGAAAAAQEVAVTTGNV